MGWFFKKKKSEPMPEPEMEKKPVNDGIEEVKACIKKIKEEPESVQAALELLALFMQNTFFVPVSVNLSAEDQASFLNAAKGDRVSLSSDMKLRPDYLKAGDGSLYFPAFTSRDETEKTYQANFSWIELPGKDIVELTKKNTELKGIVINAFTQFGVILRDVLLILDKKNVQNGGVTGHTMEKGTKVSFTRVDNAHTALRKAAWDAIRKCLAVRKAFFVKMKADEEESYLMVVGGSIKNPNEVFEKLNAVIQKAHPDLPVDYAVYPAMKNELKAHGIGTFYTNSRTETDRVCMEPTNTFFMRSFTDEDGFYTGVSFDFEYADDFHYSLSGDESIGLMKKLQKVLHSDEEDLIKLVQDYLKEELKDINKTDSAVYTMLRDFGVLFESFHF